MRFCSKVQALQLAKNAMFFFVFFSNEDDTASAYMYIQKK